MSAARASAGAESVLERFAAHRERFPDRPLYTQVDRHGRDGRSYTPETLAEAAGRVARLLLLEGLRPGDHALLAYPAGTDFVVAAVACLMTGVVPAAVHPPDPMHGGDGNPAFAAALADCSARAVLTSTGYDRFRRLGTAATVIGGRRRLPDVPWLRTDRGTSRLRPVDDWHRPESPDATALIQYTSGSNVRPKGVVITHGNLTAEATANARDLGLGPDTRFVSWLPQFHGFGLICVIVNALCGNGTVHLMSQPDFVRRPSIWFDVMSRVGATVLLAPNCAYELAVRRTTPEQRRAWDLSRVTRAMSVGEPVVPATVDRFFDAFACTGLRREVFAPTYGLTENCVSVSVNGRRVLGLDADALAEGSAKVLGQDAAREPHGERVRIGCGRPKAEARVRIVDPDTLRPCPPGRIGEIWVDSPTKAAGYLGRERETRETFHARVAGEDDPHHYLRTGDLGFLYEEELFVVGRHKALIVVRGRNHHAEDLEETVRRCDPRIRADGVAAFALDPHEESGGAGRLVVFAEVGPDSGGASDEIVESVRRAVRTAHRLTCSFVVLGEPGLVVKTTSGKVRRRACRDRFLKGCVPHASLVRSALPDDAGPSTGR
ncbi:fatty acyl-AMP ligase [Spirillospora sp. CA-253888]